MFDDGVASVCGVVRSQVVVVVAAVSFCFSTSSGHFFDQRAMRPANVATCSW